DSIQSNPVHPSSRGRGRAAHKGRVCARKKDVPLAMEGLALGDEDFFPLQDSYFPVIPSSSSSGTTEMPPNPRVLVPLGLGGAEACLDGSHGARISTPPCEADDEEDDYSDGVQLQIEASLH
ncbi:Hypothetical protein FKW44_021081, partial [Caligus rogercresseyi]